MNFERPELSPGEESEASYVDLSFFFRSAKTVPVFGNAL